MIKKKVLRGAVLLATTAAAALAACGNDDNNPDDGGGAGGADTGGSNGSGGASTGGTNSGGSNSGGTNAGGTPSTGGQGEGGEGGLGGEGGGNDGPQTAQEWVDEYCPPLPNDGQYTIIEGDDEPNSFSEYTYDTPRAYVSFGGDDYIVVEEQNSELVGPLQTPICVIGGEGDDQIWLDGTAGGVEGEYTGNAVSLTAVGGPGADDFFYGVYTSEGVLDYRPPARIKDYEAGVDTLSFYSPGIIIDTTVGENGYYEIDDFGATDSANEYSSTTQYALVIDAQDGEIWLSRYNESAQYNYLIAIVEGDTIDVDDINLNPL